MEPSSTLDRSVARWEYTIAPVRIARHESDEPVLENSEELAELGEAGWELVSIGTYPPYLHLAGVFKRAKPSYQ